MSVGDWRGNAIESDGDRHDPESTEVLPPREPTKLVGIGPNYESNVAEKDQERPETPGDLLLFVKPPNALVAHGGCTTFSGEGDFCFELELGIVIGERCRNVAVDGAESVIEGYTCVDEITNLSPPDSRYDPENLVRAKAIDNSVPIAPVVASPDLVPEDAAMELRVNNEIRQQTSRSNCVFSDAEVVEEVTSYMTLEPGDVIATGSSTGVAPLSDGDRVEISIEGIGTLEHDVRISDE